MITFKTVRFKNFLSFGNTFTEIKLDTHHNTCIIGKNAAGKCFSINTIVRLRNKNTGEIIETTIGEFYESQNKQTDT